MPTVIAFPMGRVKPVAHGAPAGCAEIVIFPGVRVERREFNPAGRMPVPRRNRRSSRARIASVEASVEE
jgi:hypothetical protein